MRILHVIGSIDPDEGGPPVIVTRLAAAQASLGHEVHLLTYRSPKMRAYWDHACDVCPGASDVTLHVLPEPTLMEKLMGGAARKAARGLMGQIDVMHNHSVWRAILRVAADEARNAGVPYLILLNGGLDPWSLSQKSTKKKLAMAVSLRKMLNGAAFLHLGNTVEGELIKPLKLTSDTVVIPNGMFLEEVDPLPAPGTFRAGRPELADRPFVLFLSRLHYKKGLDYLADSWALFCKENGEAHLVVAGPDGGAQADFEQRIATAGVQDRVHVVGPLYGVDKFAALVDCACFCLPSRQEGFSVAITEAMAHGAPVVITEGCHRHEVPEAEAGLEVDLDAPQIAQALVTMMGDADLRQTMGRNGRQLIESRFTWPIIARQTIEAYERALAG